MTNTTSGQDDYVRYSSLSTFILATLFLIAYLVFQVSLLLSLFAALDSVSMATAVIQCGFQKKGSASQGGAVSVCGVGVCSECVGVCMVCMV